MNSYSCDPINENTTPNATPPLPPRRSSSNTHITDKRMSSSRSNRKVSCSRSKYRRTASRSPAESDNRSHTSQYSHRRSRCRTPVSSRNRYRVMSRTYNKRQSHDRGSLSSSSKGRNLLSESGRSGTEYTQRHSRNTVKRSRSNSSILSKSHNSKVRCHGSRESLSLKETPNTTLLEQLVSVLNNKINAGSPGTAIHNAQHMIAEFDPQAKSQTMKDWLSKINESAHVYGWSERQTIFCALPKLKGLAKRWYDGLTSIKYTWSEWQDKLLSAFPCEQNYGDLLSEMLIRKTRRNETLEEYYYDKIMLVNRCELKGRHAVDCLTHGIFDSNVRMNVQGANLQEPEEVLKYFRNISSKVVDTVKRYTPINRDNTDHSHIKKTMDLNVRRQVLITCFNCGEQGHTVTRCSKELIKCKKCRRYGHTEKDCNGFADPTKKDQRLILNTTNTTKSVLKITNNDSRGNKYYKQVKVNGQIISGFIDFGSQCTLLRKDLGLKLNIPIDNINLPKLKGFGNGILIPYGRIIIQVELDGINERVEAYLVEPNLLPADVLIGQSFTELPDVQAYKSDTKLTFYKKLGTQTEKLPIVIIESVLLSGVTIVTCGTTVKASGSIFVSTDPCLKKGKEYMVIPGVYSIEHGKGTVIVISLNSEPFSLPQGTLISRATFISNELLPKVTTDETIIKNISSITTNDSTKTITVDQLNVDDGLQCEVKDRLLEIINSRRDCFAFSLEELGQTSHAEMHIKLKDDEPVTYRPYRLSISERGKLNAIISDMLTNGIIRESKSQYASPIILVAKKNGESRLCVDYRALNRKTIRENFPMPLIDDQIDSLSGQVFFTTLDLTSGYHQVPVSEESKPLTAFVTPDGHYEYNRMPFGLTNAPAVFQRLILNLLKKRNIPGVLAYMDDIIIASKTIDEGIEKLQAVLDLLKEANLRLNLTKCNFFKKSINYLGFEISHEGVRPGLKKIEAVAAFKVPENVHEVRQFIGLSSFFRRFVPGFASIAKPINSLTKANATWTWDKDQVKAFSELKRILTTRPVLAIYNPCYETELHNDASSSGLGGILLQRQSAAAAFRPIAYFSRQTTAEEQHFHSYELETLAVVASLNRFRVYLIGIDFKVVTDCNALRTTLSKRDLIPRIARWWLLVQEFSFSIEYRPGKQLAHADALSRNALSSEKANEFYSSNSFTNVLQIGEVHWLQSVQMSDPRLCHIKAVLDAKSQEAKDIQNNYVLKDGKIYRRVEGQLRWAVPRDARWKICQQCHDEAGHFSCEKTLEKVKRDYWFPKLTQFVKKYVRACIPCAHARQPGGKKQGFLHSIPKPCNPFQCLHIDHLGPFVKTKRGNMYILGIIDSFTKFVVIKAVKNTKSKTSIDVLKDVFGLFGVPQSLISDRGTSFTSNEFKTFVESVGLKHILNAVATPRASGQIERYNRTILASITALCHGEDDRNWDLHINQVQWSLNNTVNQSTGKSPTEIIFGKNTVNASETHLHEIISSKDISPETIQKIRNEASDKLVIQQATMKEQFDKKRCKAKVYKVGDLVMAQKSTRTPGENQKLVPAFSGPYRVTAVLDHDRYLICSVEGYSKKKYSNVFPVDKLKPWVTFNDSESESDYCDSN
ncbi:unnamed protein product [Parnassius mnemosyne]|uniref:RNA-directed DNA polymerase n=2 Tax=Parnassius mnemosyne TaxID=213953 RepID=A0AAV1K9E8_9NEOP